MDYEAKSVKKTRREVARCGKDCETQWRCQGLVRGGTAVKLTEKKSNCWKTRGARAPVPHSWRCQWSNLTTKLGGCFGA